MRLPRLIVAKECPEQTAVSDVWVGKLDERKEMEVAQRILDSRSQSALLDFISASIGMTLPQLIKENLVTTLTSWAYLTI